MHPDLEQDAAPLWAAADLHVVLVLDDASDQVLQCVDQHRQPSA